MMLRKETFPPFIHSSYCLHGEMPKALVNCMSIVQMFSTRTSASNEFVWRTIRMEQERLWVEVRTKFDLHDFGVPFGKGLLKRDEINSMRPLINMNF